jgi:hypothetical protein
VARGKRDGKITQKGMVQAALDEKGMDAGPQELGEVIKAKFNVELANNIISNYKSVIKKELKGGKPAAKAAPAGAKRGRKGGPQFTDFEAVRGLVSKLGADQVKKLVDMADMFA